MINICNTDILEFHTLTLDDRESVQAVTLSAGRRNCNFTFANLIGWQFWFNTEVCLCPNSVVFRFNMDGRRAYMYCSSVPPSLPLLQALLRDAASAGSELNLMAVEDDHAQHILSLLPSQTTVHPRRNQCDYIYLRHELAEIKGKNFKAKRNHVNKFLSEHPNFQYRSLEPSLFDECLGLEKLWLVEVTHDDMAYNITTNVELQAMKTIFSHWDRLGMQGGCIHIDGRMAAFTYGSAVTHDTFDVLVEKADRHIDGAFNIINQQFASHLPEDYTYLNREEDMGLEGLRKSKLSYHPHQLLSYNNVIIKCL